MRLLALLIALVTASAAVASVTHAGHPGGDGRDIELIASVKALRDQGRARHGPLPRSDPPAEAQDHEHVPVLDRGGGADRQGRGERRTRPAARASPPTSASAPRASAAWSSPHTRARPSSSRSRCRRRSRTPVRERRSRSRSGPRPRARSRRSVLDRLGRGAVRSLVDGHRQQGEWPDEHHRTSTHERVPRGVRGHLRIRQELGALG